MDRLHVPAATPAPVAEGAVRVTCSPAIPFGPFVSFDYRLWWYDVHRVEGAV
jgi:hypothetical protein